MTPASPQELVLPGRSLRRQLILSFALAGLLALLVLLSKEQSMPLYGAPREWLRQHGLKRADATTLLRALCTLADYEGPIKRALKDLGHSEWDFHNTCDALRRLVDGPPP